MKSEWWFIPYKPFQATEPHGGTKKYIFQDSTESLFLALWTPCLLSWLVYMWGKWSPLNYLHGLHWITWLKFRSSPMFSFFDSWSLFIWSSTVIVPSKDRWRSDSRQDCCGYCDFLWKLCNQNSSLQFSVVPANTFHSAACALLNLFSQDYK